MLRRVLLASAAAVAACRACAFYETQDITLKAGWNAVYIKVQPDKPADEVFAGWPVDSVSAYDPGAFAKTRQDAATALTSEVAPERQFLVWSRESKAASAMNSVPGDAVLVCYNKSGAEFSAQVVGRPVAPRLTWHTAKASSDQLNYVGFSVQPGVRVRPARYLKGCDAGTTGFRMLYGPDATNILFMSLSDTFEVSDGAVVLADASKTSSWSGAILASPRHGIDFGESLTVAEVSVRNDSPTNMTVEAAWIRGVSAEGSGAGAPELMELKYRDASSPLLKVTWAEFGAGTNKVLAAGETWRLQFGLDRRQAIFGTVAAGTEVGGILRFRDLDGGSAMEVKLPVSAKVQPQGTVMWPTGLWAADLDLDAVTMVMNDSTLAEGIASGGRPKVRVYLHVAEDGKTTLLQRTTIAAHARGTGGEVDVEAYAPDAEVPADAQRVVRLSSAFLPVDCPLVEGTGEFLDSAEFRFNVASDSPSNPFRHPYHPSHDGLDSDRKEKLPDGTDFANYSSAVKPELFAIGNTVRLKWDTGASSGAWDPETELEGTCSWTFTGLRREGDITATGRFAMRRVLKCGALRR